MLCFDWISSILNILKWINLIALKLVNPRLQFCSHLVLICSYIFLFLFKDNFFYLVSLVKRFTTWVFIKKLLLFLVRNRVLLDQRTTFIFLIIFAVVFVVIIRNRHKNNISLFFTIFLIFFYLLTLNDILAILIAKTFLVFLFEKFLEVICWSRYWLYFQWFWWISF